MAALRVMVVDDSEPVRATLRQMVGLCGGGSFEVVGEAADGLSAIRMARELRPDAILMDINLPGCDGITAAARIREDLEARIVMVSVENGREYFRRAMQVGAVDYLVKPFTSAGLADALRGTGADPAPTRSPVIAVWGAKGGVGTSTVALNLALALGARLGGQGAALSDLDPADSLIGVMAGVPGGNRSEEPVALTGGQVTLLPPPRLSDASWRYTAVVCDLGRAPQLMTDADRWILITTGEVAALHAASRQLRALQSDVPPERRGLVVNRAGRAGAIRPEEVAQTLDLPLLGSLPEEPAALEAVNLGKPLTQHRPRSAFAAATERLAATLVSRDKKG